MRAQRYCRVMLGGCIICLILATHLVHATVVQLTLNERITQASTILKGAVKGSHSYWKDGIIYTDVTLRVDRYLKGESNGENFILTLPGGQVGGICLSVSDVPYFLEGEEVILFLQKGTLIPLVGCFQGKLSLHEQALVGLDMRVIELQNKINRLSGYPEDFAGLTPRGKPLFVTEDVLSPPIVKPQKRGPGALQPGITGITPSVASSGTNTQVVISGSGFGTNTGQAKVEFYHGQPGLQTYIQAQIISWTSTSITCVVPSVLQGFNINCASSGNVVVTDNTGVQSPGFMYTITFGYMGGQWSGTAPNVGFFINENTSDCTGEGQAIQNAMATWTNCGSSLSFSYSGTSTSTAAAQDGTNLMCWVTGTGAVALCYHFFNLNNWPNATMPEVDIVFDDGFTWTIASTSPPLNTYDVESVALHELGHALGLDDDWTVVAGVPKVLYAWGTQQQIRRTLHAYDINGAQWIYPVTGGQITVNTTASTGTGSLDWAITQAEANPGPDNIVFAIPGSGPHTIQAPSGGFPPLIDAGTTIDGFTQPNASPNNNPWGQPSNAALTIEIDGTPMNGGIGFQIIGSNITLRGLAINNFYHPVTQFGWGVFMNGASNCQICGCHIGTNITATAPAPNGLGVYISEYARLNTIGGTTPGDLCIISGNGRDGIYMELTSQNSISNCFIGTDFTGAGPLGNGQNGLSLAWAANTNTIGPNNIIAFNGGDGIRNDDQGSLGTVSNMFTQNSIHTNTGLGISNINGGNGAIVAPTITTVAGTSVSGTTVPNATVEIFTDPVDEGQWYHGTTVSDGSGNFTWAGALSGPFVTATVTDGAGNTSNFSAPMSSGAVQITVTTSPHGLGITVDGTPYSAPQTFWWTSGSSHSIGVTSPQPGGTGIQYVYSSWSNGGAQTQSITVPSSPTTYTANFSTQYQLTASVFPTATPPCGSITANPPGPWYSPGTVVTLTAHPDVTNYPGVYLAYWSGGAGGTTNPTTVTVNSQLTVTANLTTCPGNRVRGDANGDMVVDVVDVLAVINHILGTAPLTGNALLWADCNNDGTINILDALLIVNSILGIGNCAPKLGVSTAQVWAPEISLNHTKGFELSLIVDTNMDIAGAQISLDFNPAELRTGILKLNERSCEMTLASHSESGRLSIVVYSLEGNTIPPGTDPILTIPFETSDRRVRMSDIKMKFGEVVVAGSCNEFIPVGISPITIKPDDSMPLSFSLSQNYPNPCNPSSDIKYRIGDTRSPAHISLKIYNILGQEVRTLVDKMQEPGYYTATWDGRDGTGRQVPSGVYFYTLSASDGQWSDTKRMVLLK
ncbi:MAG: matrixin family metalloprotease [Gemmatimonadota bacterium]|nr:MAG: matrixin family metalloprotease [Gemmatimonadota bacterium]